MLVRTRPKTHDEIHLDKLLWRIFISRDCTKGEIAFRAYRIYVESGAGDIGKYDVTIYSFLRLVFRQSQRFELLPFVESAVEEYFQPVYA